MKTISIARDTGDLKPCCMPVYDKETKEITNTVCKDDSIEALMFTAYHDISGGTYDVHVDTEVGLVHQHATILGCKGRNVIIQIGDNRYSVTKTKTTIYTL